MEHVIDNKEDIAPEELLSLTFARINELYEDNGIQVDELVD